MRSTIRHRRRNEGSCPKGTASRFRYRVRRLIAVPGLLWGAVSFAQQPADSSRTSVAGERRIEEIALGTAQTLRGKARVTIDRLSPPVMNDAAMTVMVRDVAAALWGEDAPQAYGPVMPCEDFSYFQEKVPGVMAFLGIRNPECGACYAQHHDKYNVDESALIRGAGMYAQTALTFLAG